MTGNVFTILALRRAIIRVSTTGLIYRCMMMFGNVEMAKLKVDWCCRWGSRAVCAQGAGTAGQS